MQILGCKYRLRGWVLVWLVAVSFNALAGDPPVLLVWLAGPGNDGNGHLWTTETEADAWAAVNRAAGRQGYKALRPLMDLEDRSTIQPADVSGRVAGVVRDASLRYSPDAVVAAYIFDGDGLWQADWLLLSGETTRRWSGRASDRDAVIDSGFADVARILAPLLSAAGGMAPPIPAAVVPGAAPSVFIPAPGSRDSSVPTAGPEGSGPMGIAASAPSYVSGVSVTPAMPGAGKILVRVAGIDSAADYNRALGAFRDNAAVASHEVLAAEPDAVIVAVTPTGGEQALAAALEATGAMRGEPSSTALGVGQGVSLHFRLLP